MKQLRIFKWDDFRRGLSLKISSFALAGTVLLTGCGVVKDEVKASSNSEVTSTTSVSISAPKVEVKEVDSVSSAIFDTKVSLSEEEITPLLVEISDIDVTYPLEDYYGIDDAYQKYLSLSNYDAEESKEIIHDGMINSEELYQLVLKNNSSFSKQSSNLYSKTTNTLVKEVTDILTNHWNKLLNDPVASKDIDRKSFEEKLASLKVFEVQSGSYAYYDNVDNLIGVDSTMIQAVEDNIDDKDTKKKVIEHEGNHFIQSHSLKEKEENGYDRFGFNYAFDDISINSLYDNWFFEGTAEQITLNTNNVNESITYQNEIKMLDSLKLATLVVPENEVNDLEYFSFQPKLEPVFDYFGCQNEDDKKEVLTMLYGVNLWLRDDYSSSSNDFYNLEQVKESLLNDYSSKLNFQDDVKMSVSTSLSKMFYRNLASTLTTNEVSTSDLFQMMTIFENDMDRILWYTDTTKIEKLEPFYEDYSKIQDQFLSIVSSSIGYSPSEVMESYEVYHANFEEETEIDFLSTDKNEFYKNVALKRKETSSKKPTISTVYDHYKEEIGYQKSSK